MKKIIFLIILIISIMGIIYMSYLEIFDYKKKYEFKVESKKIVEEIKENNNDFYLGIIKIPKIFLETPIGYGNDNMDTIKDYVSFDPRTSLPNEINSNFVLASHSGASLVAFFKNIYKLEKGDLIYIYIKNKEYKYIIYEKYEVKPTDASVLDDIDRNIITLITCKNNDNTKRLIIRGYGLE